MKLMICPECKEVIPDNELHGSKEDCLACRYRVNRDDLVELDTAKAVDSQNEGGGFFGQLGRAIANRLGQSMTPRSIPVIHSINELSLRPNMYWDENNGWDSSQTLVIKSNGKMKSMLFFAILWLAFTVPLLSFMLMSMAHDPSSVTVNGRPGMDSDFWFMLLFPVIFWGVGFGMLYFAITSCFSKTWIEITPDALLIERGLSRKGKKLRISRNSNTEVESYSNIRINHRPYYAIKLIDDQNKIKVVEGLDSREIDDYEVFFKTLLRAEL